MIDSKRFVVIIRNSNARSAWAEFENVNFCFPSHNNEGYIRTEGGMVALFQNNHDAYSVGCICKWNNQSFSVYELSNKLDNLPDEFDLITGIGELVDYCQAYRAASA
jgi:hypothetical protein